jgi:glycosyltransferase involved in cell wall biosynthesis
MSVIARRSSRPLNLVYCSYTPNSLDVRVQHPISALRARGAIVRSLTSEISAMTNPLPGAPRIVVAQRLLPAPDRWPGILRWLIARDWLVVMERDDHPIGPVASNNAIWESSMQWDGFKACHAIQTSTESLRELLSPFNSEIQVIPNYVAEMAPYMPRRGGGVRVFFGALNRRESWEPLIDVFRDVLGRHKNVQPVVLHDAAFAKALQCERTVFKKHLPYADYLRCLASCDIALMPLHDSEFTRCKSDVKFIEAGAGRVAVIASPVVYENTILDGETGLIARTPEAWGQALETLINDMPLREKLSENAFRYVLAERMLGDHIDAQIDWYYDLWERREALNEALFKRFPAARAG